MDATFDDKSASEILDPRAEGLFTAFTAEELIYEQQYDIFCSKIWSRLTRAYEVPFLTGK